MIDQLIEAIEAKQNPVALCLDTTLDTMPEVFQAAFDTAQLMGAASAVIAYNKALLKALQDVVPCVKIQPAFYERLGMPGAMALAETLRLAKDMGYITFLDGRRQGSAGADLAYAQAYLGRVTLNGRGFSAFPCDFLSVGEINEETVKIAREYGKGMFVPLPMGGFYDAMLADGQRVYEAMAGEIEAKGRSYLGLYGYSSLGMTVHTDDCDKAKALRSRLPHTFFVTEEEATPAVFGALDDERGRGVMVASARLARAWERWNTDDFATAAREEAYCLRETYNLHG